LSHQNKLTMNTDANGYLENFKLTYKENSVAALFESLAATTNVLEQTLSSIDERNSAVKGLVMSAIQSNNKILEFLENDLGI
jgi:hypothetical protein